MKEFKKYEITKDMWSALFERFGGMIINKLVSLTIKFDIHKKSPKHNMKKYLRQMSNMISEFKDAGHTLTDEQQVQAMIRSLPQSWEHMKMHLTHNKNIKTLENATCHLKLEEDRLMASKTSDGVYMADSNSHGGKWHKPKFHGGNQQESQIDAQTKKKQKFNKPRKKKKKKGFFKKKNHVSKLKCYNCGKNGNFSCDYKEPKKVNDHSIVISTIHVYSFVFLTESYSLWTIDS